MVAILKYFPYLSLGILAVQGTDTDVSWLAGARDHVECLHVHPLQPCSAWTAAIAPFRRLPAATPKTELARCTRLPFGHAHASIQEYLHGICLKSWAPDMDAQHTGVPT